MESKAEKRELSKTYTPTVVEYSADCDHCKRNAQEVLDLVQKVHDLRAELTVAQALLVEYRRRVVG